MNLEDKPKCQIVIEVSGGLVNAVFCSELHTDVLLLDHDVDGANHNHEELECYAALCAEAEELKHDLHEVY